MKAKNIIQKLIALYNIINLNLRFAEYFFIQAKCKENKQKGLQKAQARNGTLAKLLNTDSVFMKEKNDDNCDLRYTNRILEEI